LVVVHLDPWLKEFGAALRVDLPAANVGSLVDGLEERYPRLKGRLRDETGELRRFIRLFINGESVDWDGGSKTLAPGDRVDLLHSIAGG
jgi:molybdopterin synthase sulfur carrier subunit